MPRGRGHRVESQGSDSGGGPSRGGVVVRDDRERLLDIREAIERIERYARGGRSEFEASELIHF